MNTIPSLDTLEKTQCFPFYTYNEDGTNRRENITDWALKGFRAHYADESISKWDIFYYVYALLHHPTYRSRYQAALKKELPRIPFVPPHPPTPSPSLKVGEGEKANPSSKVPLAPLSEGEGDLGGEGAFHTLARIGKALADLHLTYESAPLYPLTETWAKGRPADWRVEKMKFSKDKSALTVNPSLTLSGFPAAAFGYTLGGRSALDWVVEQYQVKTDKRSGILSDPNQYSDDEKYIVELVKRVTTVSVETVRLVGELPALSGDDTAAPPEIDV
jgi:predicted helicase